ncbi:MAG: hypothetical protein IK020_08300 [Clostridiales bacterium]|nr:hypothetical protein [Clostridiales bacterium]MBR5975167.1 hypothetical protein [Clostridiales bacterium]
MSRCMIDYSKRKNRRASREEECGFFIVCDDQAILRCVNAMLLSNGMVGLSDKEGRMHYMIDGRRGGNFVLSQIRKKAMVFRQGHEKEDRYEEAFLTHAIDTVIDEAGLPPTLIGTQIVRELLFHLYRDPGLMKCASKTLYPLVRAEYHMEPSQIERNVRYAIKKSTKLKGETRVLTVLKSMMDRMMEEVIGKYGRP